MEEFDKLKESGNGLILHHLDTDGMCSATMITRFMTILDLAQGRGHISGGKREVVGANVPGDESESFRNEKLKLLEAT